MDYKIYKTPDPNNRLNYSLPYEKSIAELLLKFDDTIHLQEGIRKIVTTPAINEVGFHVVACQSFFPRQGNAAYLFLPETEDLYSFTEAIFPIRDRVRSFLKIGLKGLFCDAEEKGILAQEVQPHDYDEVMFAICAQQAFRGDWYHFTGTAEKILEELQKKSRLRI